jgi:pimeloyl-ACP methyl ester carboxylesterase
MSASELDAIAPFERYYDAAGIRTRCFEKGEGKPVILLHGGGGHAETWVRNLIPLSQKFRVLAIDYLGHGYTDKPKITYNLALFLNTSWISWMPPASRRLTLLASPRVDRLAS